MTTTTIRDGIASLKADINELVGAGGIPDGIRSYSEVHDYYDANMLGTLADVDTDEANAIMGAVDLWLASGRTTDRPDQDTLTRALHTYLTAHYPDSQPSLTDGTSHGRLVVVAGPADAGELVAYADGDVYTVIREDEVGLVYRNGDPASTVAEAGWLIGESLDLDYEEIEA